MRRALACALILLAACRTAPPSPAPPDWPRYVLSTGADGAPGYSVAVPADIVRRHVQGIDSEVAEFAAPGLRIGFDYGWYSGIQSCGRTPGCRTWTETIDGRLWRYASYPLAIRGETWVTRGYGAHVKLNQRMSLAVHAACADEAACERAAAVARTVEFGAFPAVSPPPAGPPPPRASAYPPQPHPPLEVTPRPCARVGEAEARAFRGLEPMGTSGDYRIFGRRRELLCSEPGAGGQGECEAPGRTEVRIEFPGGASGFRIDGSVPVVVGYSPGGFSCEPSRGPR